MSKRTAGTRINEEIYKRLEKVAKVDRRTIANVIEICVEEYLPKLEAEILRETPEVPAMPQETRGVRYPPIKASGKK